MKKLIGLLATTGLLVGASTTVISCGCGKEEANSTKKEDISKNEKLKGLVVQVGKTKEEAKDEINKKMVEIKAELKEGVDYQIDFGNSLDKEGRTIDNEVINIKSLKDSKYITGEAKILISNKKSLKSIISYNQIGYVEKADSPLIIKKLEDINKDKEKLDFNEIDMVNINKVDNTQHKATIKPKEGSTKYIDSLELTFYISNDGKQNLKFAIVETNIGKINKTDPETILAALKKHNSFIEINYLMVSETDENTWALIAIKEDGNQEQNIYTGEAKVTFTLS